MQIYIHYNWTQFKRKNAVLHFLTKKARLNGTYYDTLHVRSDNACCYTDKNAFCLAGFCLALTFLFYWIFCEVSEIQNILQQVVKCKRQLIEKMSQNSIASVFIAYESKNNWIVYSRRCNPITWVHNVLQVCNYCIIIYKGMV